MNSSETLRRAVGEVVDSIPGTAAEVDLAAVPRVLGRAGHAGAGPVLLCVGGVHGNEPAGVVGLARVLRRLAVDPTGLQGLVVGLAGNRRALARGQRFIGCDLNRLWLEERLARRGRGARPGEPEEEELWELAGEIRRALNEAEGRAFLLDLHTTSGGGPAFAVLDDTLPNRGFALSFPVPLVLGLEEEIEGTLTHHYTTRGVVAVAFEAGRHLDPSSVERSEAAVWIALAAAGVLARGSRSEVPAARRRLAAEHNAFPHVVEVRYRHAITAADEFRMLPGLRSFTRVEHGGLLARDRRGDVVSPAAGFLLMPLYQKLGDDGFFLVREVRSMWLGVSALLRRARLERWIHWLPGVARHPELPASFVVDRKVARWVALQLFHLLGFRRRGKPSRFLVMSRRAFDQPRKRPRPV